MISYTKRVHKKGQTALIVSILVCFSFVEPFSIYCDKQNEDQIPIEVDFVQYRNETKGELTVYSRIATNIHLDVIPGENVSILGKTEFDLAIEPGEKVFEIDFELDSDNGIIFFELAYSSESGIQIRTGRAFPVFDSVRNRILPENLPEARESFLDSEVSREELQTENSLSEISQSLVFDVEGYFYYHKERNQYDSEPIANAKVILWDDEPWGREQIGNTQYTDSNGYFCFSNIDNNDGFMEGGRDLYVAIYMENGSVLVTHGPGDSESGTWAWRTEKVSDISEEDIENGHLKGIYYIWYPPGFDTGGVDYDMYCGSARILFEITEAYEFLKNNCSDNNRDLDEDGSTYDKWNQPKVEAKWPSSGSTSFFSPSYYVEFGNDWDAFNQDVVMHEYSHAVMWKLYDNDFPNGGPYISSHWFTKETNPYTAFIEGWAEYLPNVIQRDDNYRGYHVETVNFYVTRDDQSKSWNGNSIEGAVLNILYDLTDDSSYNDLYPSSDDDDIHSFAEVWRVMRDYNPDALVDYPNYTNDFWDRFSTADEEELWRIFYEHGINKDSSDPNISNIYHLPSMPVSSQSVHVYADVIDDLSGIKYVKCCYCVNGGTDYAITMIRISGDTYRTSSPIPAQPGGSTVRYFIDTEDNSGNPAYSLLYQYTVQQDPPELYVNPLSHDFGTMNQGQTNNWTFYIENTGGGTLSWNVNESLSWITVSPTNGTTSTETDSVTVTINTTGLTCGQYYSGYISVTSNGGNAQVHVEVNITTCAQPDFTLSTSPSSQSVCQGGSAPFTINLTSQNGFSSAVSLTISDIPNGCSASFAPNPVTPTGTSTLTITVSPSTAPGTYYLTITGNGGGKTHSTDAVLTVIECSNINIQFTSYFLDDDYYGNDDGIINPGEFIRLSIVLENTGTQPAYGVTATATTTSLYINYSCAYPPYLTPFFGDVLGGGIGVGYMYFMVSNAPDGTTITFNLTITDSSGNTWYDSFDIVVTGTDTLPPRSVRLQVSPQLLNVGNTVTIMALVEEGDDMSFGSVMAQIETSNKAVVTTIVLYDDGAHNDLDAGDGVYGGSWITTLPGTDYLVSILTTDRSGNAAEWNDLAGFTTKTFTVSNKILLVDDDNHNLNSWVTAAPYQSYYTAALDANGLPYDVWEHFFRGSPPSSILIQYDVVIWLTGDTYGASYFPQGYYVETLSSTDQTNLMTYLEGGGNLFICGQDIGYDLNGGDPNDESFYANYLHAAFVQDRTNLFGLYGVTGNPITDGLYFSISGGDSANNQLFASEIDPINGAITILTYDPNATLLLQQSIIQKTRGPFEREGDIQPLTSQLLQGIISSGSGAISVDTGTYKVIYFAFGLEAIDNPADRNIIMRKMVNWLQGTAEGSVPQLFDTNSYLVVGDNAYCTDVLGTAKISYGLALGGASKNPEGRTHTLLTAIEHDTGNLIIVGGPAVSPVAKEFGIIFNIEYEYIPGVSFEILWGGESIFLDLARYPQEDICIIYLGEHNGRNVMLVWGYGWEGSYAGSAFIGDPANWQEYEGANMLMLRWRDIDTDGLVQMSEITVETYKQPLTAKTVIRGVVNWLRGITDWVLSLLFNTSSYFVVGDEAYCTDVLGTAKISYGLAQGGASENPEGRTDVILTQIEHDTGNLIIVGGPAVSPVAKEFGIIFNIEYEYIPGVSFEILWGGESIFLDLARYPQEDICIIYLGEHNGRNVMLVWGYGWEGSYAGSIFAGDPETWQTYADAHMFMLRWIDSNSDGLVQ